MSVTGTPFFFSPLSLSANSAHANVFLSLQTEKKKGGESILKKKGRKEYIVDINYYLVVVKEKEKVKKRGNCSAQHMKSNHPGKPGQEPLVFLRIVNRM